MRMLMNNLDPDVAERPEDLVVYGGTGRAARSWEAYDAIVRTLTTLGDDETLLVQSGKPVGVFRTHPHAPRVLIANSMLVPKWADWDTFRELEHAGLTMYGQMTAGSWIYIGTQGILQGTYETLAECATQRFGGSLAGTVTLTGGLGGMGGAQPLAVTMNGGVALCVEVDPARIERRLKTRYLDRETDDLDTALAWAEEAKAAREARVDRAARATAPRCCPTLVARGWQPDVVTDQTSAHDPLGGYVPGGLLAGRGRGAARGRPRRTTNDARTPRWPRTSTRSSRSRSAARSRSTTGTTCAPGPSSAGWRTSARTPIRGSCPRSSGRCSARARARSGGPRSRATRRTSRATDRAVAELFPDDERLHRWLAHGGASASRSRACRRGSAGSATASARRAGLRFNEMVASRRARRRRS